MKQKFLVVTVLLMGIIGISTVCFAACSSDNDSEKTGEENQNENDMEKIDLGKTLIVYYSFSGNTKGIAEFIAEKTDGTLFEIETVEPYNATIKEDDPMSHVYEIAAIVQQQEKDGILPELKAKVENLDSYDLIIIGSPKWMPIPPPIKSFLAQYDFAGKRIAPYYTYRSTAGDYFEQFAKIRTDATILPGEKFSHAELSDKNKVSKWLESLKQ